MRPFPASAVDGAAADAPALAEMLEAALVEMASLDEIQQQAAI